MTAEPTLGLGLLSWGLHTEMDSIIAGYRERGLFDLVDQALIWFQEIGEDERAFAERHGLPCDGTPENYGILGGFKNMAAALSTDFVLLLENDLPLIEDRDETARQIAQAKALLKNDDVKVVRLRHRAKPGQKFDTLAKYNRYHGPGAAPTLRRTLRPGKAKKLAGTAVYAEAAPAAKFPKLIEPAGDGAFLVSSECMNWTNQSIMIRRDFFLDTIIAEAEANPSPRRVNGFPDIEKEWNSPKWRKSGWKIGVPKGLLTHERP